MESSQQNKLRADTRDEIVMEEDVQFSIICIIQEFFEQKPTEDVFKYFESINKLVGQTNELIEKEVKNSTERVRLANSINKARIDDYWESNEELKDKSGDIVEAKSLLSNPQFPDENIRLRVGELRDKLIINELEDRHSCVFEKISALFQVHIEDQMEELIRDRNEILYFTDFNSNDDPEILNMNRRLISDHCLKMKEKLPQEITNCPELLVEYACELFCDYANQKLISKHHSDEETKEEFKIEDIDDIQEEWETMSLNILNNVYNEKTAFWDQEIIGDNPDYIDQFLTEFLLSQRINSKRELKELQRCFTGMSTWMVKCMPWRKYTIDDYSKIFDSLKSDIKIYSRTVDLDINDLKFNKNRKELNSYIFKFILIHLCAFLTKNVNANSQFSHSYYNASYAQFLRSFVKSFYPKIVALKIVRSIETAMGNFNLKTLNIEIQNPIKSVTNAVYKVEDYTSRLDFIKFVKQISDHEDEFEEYLESTSTVDKFGEINEYKLEELKKENYKLRSRYLISCMKMLSEYKESELLKAHFDLISSNYPSSKHIMISISGLQSGGGKLCLIKLK